jgi:hypothetical protein
MDLLAIIKSAYYMVCGWVTTVLLYFLPIEDLVVAIGIAFAINFAFGIIAGIVTQKEGIDFKKALWAFAEVAVYLVILSCLYAIGDHMKKADLIFKMASILTWGWIAFYISNWSKNAKRLFPRSRGIAFFYYVFNLEFMKQLPYFKNFERYEKTNPMDSNGI